MRSIYNIKNTILSIPCRRMQSNLNAVLSPILSGIRVLDLTRILVGPLCTSILGDYGAEIIKIEPPEGDETRRWGPPFLGADATYFLAINRNKKSLCVNLKTV